MSEKNNILYLCVLMALSDFDLQKEEVHKIIKISEELKIDFNVHDAFEEIKSKFRDDKDLTAKRREAGAVIESAVMIAISDEYFTNYPDAYTKH